MSDLGDTLTDLFNLFNADPEFTRLLEQARKELREGKTRTYEEVFGHPLEGE